MSFQSCHDRDAIHPKWFFRRYSAVEGTALERIVQLFFSYHYFFLLAIVWATTLNVVLQTAFVSIIPAIVESGTSVDVDDVEGPTTPSAPLDPPPSASLLELLPLIGTTLGSLVVCSSVALLGVRLMNVIGDAMVVDGWWCREDRHSTYMIRLVEYTTGSRLQQVSLGLCATLMIASVVQLVAMPISTLVPTFGTAMWICGFQAAALFILFLINLPQVLWLGRRWDDVGERYFFYSWVWLRWSTFTILLVTFSQEAATGALWEALSNLISTTIILIVPHVLVGLISRTHTRLWNCLELFAKVVRYRTLGMRMAAVVAVFASGAAFYLCQWMVETHGLMSLLAVGYAAMSTAGNFLHLVIEKKQISSKKKQQTHAEADDDDDEPVSPFLSKREISVVLNDIPRRRFVKTLIRGLVGLSVVLLYGIVAAVLHQRHEDAPPLAIQHYSKEDGVLVTEHLKVQSKVAADDVAPATQHVPEAHVPVYCRFREAGLSFFDYAWLGFLPYFSHRHENYNAVLETYLNGRFVSSSSSGSGQWDDQRQEGDDPNRKPPNELHPDWVEVSHSDELDHLVDKGLLNSRVTFVELYSNRTNTSLVLVRGTDINNKHDVLQDFTLFLEVGIFQLLTFFVPGVGSLPDTVIAEIIGATSTLTRLMEPNRMYYYEPLTEFVRSLKAQRKHVVLCGHSLGAAVAQIAGVKTETPVVAISSPGVALSSKKFGLNLRKAQDHVVSLVPEFDVAARVDKQAGTVFAIPCAAQRPDRCHLLEFTLATLWEQCPNLRHDFSWKSLSLVTPLEAWR